MNVCRKQVESRGGNTSCGYGKYLPRTNLLWGPRIIFHRHPDVLLE